MMEKKSCLGVPLLLFVLTGMKPLHAADVMFASLLHAIVNFAVSAAAVQ